MSRPVPNSRARARSKATAQHTATQAAHMASSARLAELGAILATGHRRLVLSRQKALDESAASERPCDPTVNRPENDRAKEVA